MIRIVIADDHHLVRQGIRALLEKQPDMQIVGEAEDGQQAVQTCLDTIPDVLLLDINMPISNGIDVTKRIKESGIKTQVLILSMYSDLSLVRRAFSNGARGYLLKKSITDDLINGIHSASLRQNYISPALPDRGNGDDWFTEPSESESEGFNKLTDREREVCQLIAEGMTNQAIACRLSISIKTVEKHRANLMYKLGVSDIASLIRQAIKNGLVFLDVE
jgi:DNA-binding NarL/FixJ family response regulator